MRKVVSRNMFRESKMPSIRTYQKWLSLVDLPLQALLDLAEGVEPSTADCELLEEYRRLYASQDSDSPVSIFSEEEQEGGLVENLCESLLRITYNGGRSSRFLHLYELAQGDIGSGSLPLSLRTPSRIETSALPGFEYAIAPIFWIGPDAFFRWAGQKESFTLPINLVEALPEQQHSHRMIRDNEIPRVERPDAEVAAPLRNSTPTVQPVADEKAHLPGASVRSEVPVGTVEQATNPELDEVDIAILKVLDSRPHALFYSDIADGLPAAHARNRNTVSQRCKHLASLGLVSLPPRKGAQITPAGHAIVAPG